MDSHSSSADKTKAWWENYFDSKYIQIWELFQGISHDDVENDVLGIANLLELNSTDRILDVGCGYGRYLLRLMELGYHIIGIDRSIDMLSKLKNKSEDLFRNHYILQVDMRNIPFVDDFTKALLLGGTFGYFSSVQQDKIVIKEIREVLANNGMLLLDCVNKVNRIKNYLPSREFGGDNAKIKVTSYYNENQRVFVETINYKDGTINRQKTSYVRLFSLIEIQELLRSASFSIENVWADFMGSEYNDQNSKRIIIRARKI